MPFVRDCACVSPTYGSFSRSESGIAPSRPLLHRSSYRFVPSPEIVNGSLYRRRVQHDADRGTEGLGREVVLELGAYDTRVSVRAGDLSPDDLGGVSDCVGAYHATAHVWQAIHSVHGQT